MKLAIIANPVAGRGRAYRKLRDYLQRWQDPQWQPELLATRCPGHAGEIAHELLSNPPDLLAICGGDGTVCEVASRVPDPPFPVALIPAGTANVLAKEIGIARDPVSALRQALSCRVKRVDLGLLTGRTHLRFLLMAGVGFDACIVAKVRPALKARIGTAAYLLAVLQRLPVYSFPEFQVTTEAGSFPASSCIVANAKGYGGGLVFSPDADFSDGLLDVLVLQGKSRLAYARLLLNARRGKPPREPWVHRCRAKAVKIEGPRGIWVQADGELTGTLPIDISVIPCSFPLVFPP